MSLISKLIVKTLPIIPKSVVGYFARPYIAGDSLAEGIRVVKELNAKGIMATMDVLGESVSSKEESLAMRDQCEEVLRAIHEHKLDSNLSVKPTQLGLSFDEKFCEDNLRHLCAIAKEQNNFVRIDMEDHPYTDATIALYKQLRKDFMGHVGTVIQSYLRRSLDDVSKMIDEDRTNLRLCKGIYIEPEEIAYKDKQEVRESYKRILREALSRGAYIGIATHDDELIDNGAELVKELGLKPEQYEYQMLLGVRPSRRDGLVQAGHRMRVYVPFGERWYAYSTRRLKENPNMAMHIVKGIFGMNK